MLNVTKLSCSPVDRFVLEYRVDIPTDARHIVGLRSQKLAVERGGRWSPAILNNLGAQRLSSPLAG